MKTPVLRIAFSGPGGLGKSLLAKHISGLMPDLPHPPTSSREVFQKGDHHYLWDNFSYREEGHRAVINLSGANPDFGIEFQRILLQRRTEQMKELHDSGYILDRCPIDNVAYILSQIGHNLQESNFEYYLSQAREAYKNLTHVILVKYSPDIPPMIGSNKDITNRYFQRYISDVFMGVYNRYFSEVIGPRVIVIDFWDLHQRIEIVNQFIKETHGNKEN